MSRATRPAPGDIPRLRRALWDLPAPCICPVLGACLEIGQLRQRLDALFGGSSSHLDDFALHVAVVGQCGDRNKVSELVGLELDLVHADAIAAAARVEDDAALASHWSHAVAGGDVAGAFWAVLSHPLCSEDLTERLLADLHMIQHRSIAALRHAVEARDRLEAELVRWRAASAPGCEDAGAVGSDRTVAVVPARWPSLASAASQVWRWAVGGLVFCAFAVAMVAVRAAPASVVPAASAASASPAASATSAASASPRYTFSWPLDAGQPRPRGGVTHGAPVVLDPSPSPAWRALQADGLATPERDRLAILAMAGTYRVSFDFLEIATFGAAGRPAPYQSWGTEKVYVDRDEPGFISLVHILEMRLLDKDGAVGETFVTKHWRQDWRYEPESIVEYRGLERWQRRTLSAEERRGAWLQSVHQVDESPRYAALGRWQHSASCSTWASGETWRPLPRREWSVRDDYQVLLGTNRHTIVPGGWLQEENNLKTVLAATGALDTSRPYVGREYGVARYERIRAGADFAEADLYYAKTRTFWNAVVAQWDDAFSRLGAITLRGPVDKLGLYEPLFERADRIAGSSDPEPIDLPAIKAMVETMRAAR